MNATINETGYNWLLEKLAKLSAKGGTLTLTHVTRIEDDHMVYDVELTGEAPTIPGFTFIGVVEHLSGDGESNILKSAPDHELPATYRHALPVCHHCGTIRRRNQTYVLRNDAVGGHIQVGRNCLADFLRSADAAERLVEWAGWLDEITTKLASPEYTSTGSGRWYFGVDDLVRIAVAYVHAGHRWVSGRESQETGIESSAGQIRSFLCNPFRRWNSATDDPMRKVTELAADCPKVAAEADAVTKWVSTTLAGKDDATLSNYEHNLVTIFTQSAVTSDKIPLVMSATRAYVGYTARQERLNVTPSTHVGTVGVRSEHRVCVLAIRSLGVGDYGERFLVKMRDEFGNEMVWFTGENCPLEENRDAFIWIAGRVEHHGEYNGRPQTTVSRVKKLDGPTPPKKPRKTKKVTE